MNYAFPLYLEEMEYAIWTTITDELPIPTLFRGNGVRYLNHDHW